MANIVQQTSQSNHVNRSTFDLSGNINLTAAPGMLLPIRVDDCLPNSRYDFNMAMFARTVQMVVPSFARVKAHVDTFFVPYRLLGTDIAATIVGDKRGMESCYKSDGTFDATGSTGLPYFDLSHIVKVTSNTASFNFPTGVDAAGVDVNVTSPILVNALGYGVPNYGNFPVAEDVSSNVPNNLGKISIASKSLVEGNYYAGKGKFSPLYLLAYNKIYQDYYRNKLWEKENKASYFVKSSEMNSDITTRLINSGSFEMRYHDYDKDRIIGMIPDENGILSDGLSQYASTILSASNGLDSTSSLGGSQNPITTPKLFRQILLNLLIMIYTMALVLVILSL